MENMIEIVSGAVSMQALELVEPVEDAKYLAVPFGFRSLPLIVWAETNGYLVAAEDAWESLSMNHYRERPVDYPANMSVARLAELDLQTANVPEGIAVRFESDDMGQLPPLVKRHSYGPGMEVEAITVGYELTHGDGSQQMVRLKPDYFIFEDSAGEYTIFYQASVAEVSTQSYIPCAGELFMRPHYVFNEFRRIDQEEEQDYIIMRLGIDAALLRKDYRTAMRAAAYHFGVPIDYVKNILPEG